MQEITALVQSLSRLTDTLTWLTCVLVTLTLVDCGFLYRRIVSNQKKRAARKG